jgi:2-polyprenyl-6-methoxyphenol hydroxylase-like FAD-dependent oxidoreductase
MEHEETEVAIIGAGPVGLTAACVLRRAGVEVVVLDAVAAGANTSRAAVVHARTLEVLEAIDVSAWLLEAGLVVPEFTVREGGSVLARLDFRGLPTAYPFTLMVPQSTTETILLARLRELGGTVRREHRTTQARSAAGGATVAVTRPDGSEYTLRSRFTIGADGIRSVVRDSLGIHSRGATSASSFILADVELDWPLPAREVQLFFAPSGLVVVAPLPGGRHRVVATMDEAPPSPGRDEVQALLDDRGPGFSRVGDVAWSSRFRVQHRLVDRYRQGSVLLAGDAAHAHSPAGGQGMNIGIQDAVDLATSLTEALRGEPDLLDGYEARRRPVAAEVIRFTDRMTRAATLTHPVARGVRNVAVRTALGIPAVRGRLTSRLAELEHR